jgi:NAD+ synthase (glutamine-hydrolysing)
MKIARVALAQINPTVGDIDGNTLKIIDYIKKAKKQNAGIVLFPELAVTGYPPEDLLLKPDFIERNLIAIKKIEKETSGLTVIAGFVDKKESLYNSAAIFNNGRLLDVYHKMHLPNYGVFDEYRYFRAGTKPSVYKINGMVVGIEICEDTWEPGTIKSQSESGAEIIFSINASPYHMGKLCLRKEMLSKKASDNKIPIVYVNMVGGQDELVFDGGSMIIDKNGQPVLIGKQFEETMIVSDINLESNLSSNTSCALTTYPIEEEVYRALSLGTKDYVHKNGFKKVVIGLSGGIDSSLVAAIAVDAIGKENVIGIFMPSQYTSKQSEEDAFELAGNLGIKIKKMPIDQIFKGYSGSFEHEFRDLPQDITEENLQSRIRGNILMAFSNKFGWLVLTTGNKSEMSVGYATLYGDMAGGFAIIKDVPKTFVYQICKWINKEKGRALIPEQVLIKEPTAELKPGQKDSDTLPPYNMLDNIIKAYVEEDKNYNEILAINGNKEVVQKVINMIDKSEYKRRQSPPGVKITPRALEKTEDSQ